MNTPDQEYFAIMSCHAHRWEGTDFYAHLADCDPADVVFGHFTTSDNGSLTLSGMTVADVMGNRPFDEGEEYTGNLTLRPPAA